MGSIGPPTKQLQPCRDCDASFGNGALDALRCAVATRLPWGSYYARNVGRDVNNYAPVSLVSEASSVLSIVGVRGKVTRH